MAKVLNFNNVKKQYMTVTLPDEKKTTLMIGTPTKAVMDEFIGLGESIKDAATREETMDQFYGMCARIMSLNKGGIKITKEQLENVLDFEDIMIFVRAYTDFINGITTGKN